MVRKTIIETEGMMHNRTYAALMLAGTAIAATPAHAALETLIKRDVDFNTQFEYSQTSPSGRLIDQASTLGWRIGADASLDAVSAGFQTATKTGVEESSYEAIAGAYDRITILSPAATHGRLTFDLFGSFGPIGFDAVGGQTIAVVTGTFNLGVFTSRGFFTYFARSGGLMANGTVITSKAERSINDAGLLPYAQVATASTYDLFSGSVEFDVGNSILFSMSSSCKGRVQSVTPLGTTAMSCGVFGGAFRLTGVYDLDGHPLAGLTTTQSMSGVDYGSFQGPPLPVAGVPEPGSWALLIAGFGLTGTTLRRRRVACVAA